jgi:hypothetical protein
MALSEFEIKKIEKAAGQFLDKRRPPVSIRNELDLGWRLDKHSFYFFERRPVWNDPSVYQDLDCLKAIYVRTQGTWKIYWMRQDLKWHSYEPCKQVKTIEQVLDVLDKDQHGCFLG